MSGTVVGHVGALSVSVADGLVFLGQVSNVSSYSWTGMRTATWPGC